MYYVFLYGFNDYSLCPYFLHEESLNLLPCLLKYGERRECVYADVYPDILLARDIRYIVVPVNALPITSSTTPTEHHHSQPQRLCSEGLNIGWLYRDCLYEAVPIRLHRKGTRGEDTWQWFAHH